MKILIIGLQFPEPKSTAAGTRMLQLISLFQDIGFSVHFASAKPASDFSANLDNINVFEHSLQLNDNSAKVLLDQLKPEVVMFDRFITEEQFGWVVEENCSNALKILDTEDLHFLRENRETSIKKLNTETDEYKLTDKAKREIAAIYRCDLTLMISRVEIDILVQKFNLPAQILVYLPFVLDIDKKKYSQLSKFDIRKHFVSIGNFKHKPNLDMVNYLHQNIWPKIRYELPEVEWHIYGAYRPQHIKELHKPKQGIIVKGRAEEAIETLQKYKVALAPLRFGAGLKGKCIDSMQAGTPSVTSTIGAEGIASAKDWPGFVEDEVEEFCDAAVLLYQSSKLWEIKQQLGYEILKTKFDKDNFQSDFSIKIYNALKHLKDLRGKNIIGEILKYHHHRSTKYMSLWIQEKNT